MSDKLATYLHDHLAGSNFAVELLEFLRDQHVGPPGAIPTLLTEIEEDRAVLNELIERVGQGAPMLKEAAAWISEKMSKLKLGKDMFGAFQGLELLALGIRGKLALWKALKALADPRLSNTDFDRLIERAEDQHARAEELRLSLAKLALSPVTK